MRNTFNVLFYIKKNAPLRNGNVPIMGRITINGERTQFSTRLSVAPEHWDVGMGRVAGRSNAAGRINEQLSNIHYHIERCYNKLFYEQSFVTPMVKEMYFGANLRQETVLAFFRQHNEEFNRMVGISRSSFYKYKDDIFPFHDNAKGKTITFMIQMDDETGLLSDVLHIVADYHANILTIHQSIPVNNVATLTLSVEVRPDTGNISHMVEEMEENSGVHNVKIIARE